MRHNTARKLAAAACLALFSCSNDSEPAADSDPPAGDARTVDSDVSPLDGRWTGSWGGGAQGDVVFQPVLAKLAIEGDHVRLSDFPDAAELTGTIRYDRNARRIFISQDIDASGAAALQALEYAYDLSGDQLTLTAVDGRTISMLRHSGEHVEPTHQGVPEP